MGLLPLGSIEGSCKLGVLFSFPLSSIFDSRGLIAATTSRLVTVLFLSFENRTKAWIAGVVPGPVLAATIVHVALLTDALATVTTNGHCFAQCSRLALNTQMHLIVPV